MMWVPHGLSAETGSRSDLLKKEGSAGVLGRWVEKGPPFDMKAEAEPASTKDCGIVL